MFAAPGRGMGGRLSRMTNAAANHSFRAEPLERFRNYLPWQNQKRLICRLLSSRCFGSEARPFCSGADGTSSATWFTSTDPEGGGEAVRRLGVGLLSTRRIFSAGAALPLRRFSRNCFCRIKIHRCVIRSTEQVSRLCYFALPALDAEPFRDL